MFANARVALRDPATVQARRWLTLLVLCISLIVITVDNTILNVAIPTLAHSKSHGGLGATASQLQRIVDAYTLVFAGLLLTAGSLGDRFGRYGFLAFGLAAFGTGSAMSVFASGPLPPRPRPGRRAFRQRFVRLRPRTATRLTGRRRLAGPPLRLRSEPNEPQPAVRRSGHAPTGVEPVGR